MLLDEAFAGIDDAARAHCMGLIREFDLDFVLTSEREWALLCRTARRRDLPIATARRHRRCLRLAMDVGRPGEDTRSRPGPQVCPAMSGPVDARLQRLLGEISLPCCASACAGASSALALTSPSSAFVSMARRRRARGARLVTRPPAAPLQLSANRRSFVDNRLAALRDRFLLARRAGTARRSDRRSRRHAPPASKSLVERNRQMQPSRSDRFPPSARGHRPP